ncbi:MAG: extracellular solute-binding protein, partial [Paenibacillaceae bacterium]|nr:extracellular solute-binding protein [Paenibacillaceae bacterium]
MVRKSMLVSLGLIVMAGSVAACGGGSDSKDKAAASATPAQSAKPSASASVSPSEAPKEKVKLKFFTGKVETVDLMNDLIAKFNKENPNITVEQEYQKDASNVIKVKFASGDVPDITTVVSQDYVDQGKYLDLSGESFWTRVVPAIKDLSTDVKTGKQFKVATNMTMGGIFYNKKIFAELGLKEALTWADFKQNLA